MSSSHAIRARLRTTLRRDLIGPGQDDPDLATELLSERPGRWVAEPSWPSPNITMDTLALDAGGRLSKAGTSASEFAVHLDHVRENRAPKDYQDPARFFERTYLTKNLKDLAGAVDWSPDNLV